MRQFTSRSLATAVPLIIFVLGVITTATMAMDEDDCLAGWSAPFGGDGGVDNIVWTITEFDDGSSPAVYVGGSFSEAGGVDVSRLARWDGEKWEAIEGTTAVIASLAVFDDGNGPALYVAGIFSMIDDVPGTTGIARWDGAAWSSVGGGTDGTVTRLHVADDGSGPALYASDGTFTTAGGVEANGLARWDGTKWTSLGGGVSGGAVNAIATFDDGNGPALYVAGSFTAAGGTPVNHVARWDGANWSAVGGGTNSTVQAMAIFDDGTGDALYAAGSFTEAGGVNAQRVASWNGEEWSSVGSGLSGGAVLTLTTHSDGDTTMLYAGGSFTTADGMEVNRLARWNGATWSSLETGVNNLVRTLYSSPSSAELYIGGHFTDVYHGQDGNPDMRVGHIVRWTNERLLTLGSAPTSRFGTNALGTFDSGSGEELYTGVADNWVGGGTAPWMGRWDGSAWVPMDGGPKVFGGVLDMKALTFEGGPAHSLYVVGALIVDGAFNGIARWDGAAWFTLGSGLSNHCHAVEIFDDGSGESLYVGGRFKASMDGAEMLRIARWDGNEWHPLGEGVGSSLSHAVWALQSFDDGTGPALYVGGHFTQAGGKPIAHIARWNGNEWSAVGDGLNSSVRAMTVFDDGTGPALYVAGTFTASGDGDPLSRIARWDGKSWSPVGGGVNDHVLDLHVFEDCSGPSLYAGGYFTMADDIEANRIARWDGTSWSALGCGVTNPDPEGFPGLRGIATMRTVQEGAQSVLYVGGNFRHAGGQPAGHIARWEGEQRVGDLNYDCVVDGADLLILLSAWGECPEGATCPADLNGDGIVDGADLLILLANWG